MGNLHRELRIGNYITYDPKYNIPTQIKEIYEYGVHTGYKKAISYDNIHPIELSEDWLIRMGWKRSLNSYCFGTINEYGRFGVFIEEPYKGTFKLESTDVPQKVYYVHQLQNLYYSLTGSELTITDINIEG